jgi:hypothetical protein
MARPIMLGLALVCSSFVFDAQPALAQQTFNVSLGYFTPRGQDARVSGDVLNANLDFLEFNIKDFNGAAVGGEWLFPLGNYIEGGAGVAFTRRTVPTVYARLVNANGSEIDQELKLRTVPAAFTFRVLPLGQNRGFQPYLGGGIGLVMWRYSESGQFVETRDNSIFNNAYAKSGTAAGPVALGGIRFAGDSFASGVEIRYQAAEGDLAPPFAGTKIDLGGWSYLFTVGGRFGR